VEIGMRLLCSEARVQWHKVRAGMVAAEDWGRIVEAAEILDPAPVHIIDTGNATIVDIRAKARRLKSQQGLGLIIVDYLQLMTSHQRVDNRQQEVAEISRSLKLLAKELEVPIIAVSQLNRDPERRTDKKPQLADLRECVTGDTLVTLADGRRREIRELVGTTPEVLAVSESGRVVRARSDRVWRVGRRAVFEVLLASGRRVRATAKHRLLGATGWVRVGDLRAGDRVAIARRLPQPTRTVEWPEARVALLGQLMGDGSYLNDQPLRYTTASEENSALVANAARSEFGCVVRRYRGRGAWHQLLITGNGNRWHPAGVNRWLRELGVFGQRSHQKRVPDEAFRLSNHQIALLLRHLWATDGSVHVRRTGERGRPSIYFSTCSRGLAEDVAALLLRLGIVSRLQSVRQDLSRPWFMVVVSGAAAQRLFMRRVGVFGPRRQMASKVSMYLAVKSHNTNVDTLPRQVSAMIGERMARAGLSPRDMALARGVRADNIRQARFAPSRTLVADYARILRDDQLRRWVVSDLFWDRVVSVASAGEEDVYDISVPGPESWLADALVSHNSGALEQDSDVVLFIHRDPLSEDAQAKGTAEIIIAKHRNGPVGKITLTWLEHLTLFRNYAREQ
jgi:replicative DNA helicase